MFTFIMRAKDKHGTTKKPVQQWASSIGLTILTSSIS